MNQGQMCRQLFQYLSGFPCTISLLAAIWFVFGVELHAHALGNEAILLRLGALPMDTLSHGEYWRLITYAGLHSGWWHIAVNTSLLLVAGPVTERTLESRLTLAISILGAVLGAAAILAVHHGETASSELGASGAFFALLGAGLVMSWQSPSATLSRVGRRLLVTILLGLAISFLPEVSMAAHLAGLTIGSVIALAMRLRERAKLTNSEVHAEARSWRMG
jgi:rhomboid protease GluP